MRLFRTHVIWIWLLGGVGSAIGLQLLVILGYRMGEWFDNAGGVFNPIGYALALVLVPQTMIWNSWWRPPVEGAVIAVILCLVDRAFNRPDQEIEAKQPAA
jgi:hypothetical protein